MHEPRLNVHNPDHQSYIAGRATAGWTAENSFKAPFKHKGPVWCNLWNFAIFTLAVSVFGSIFMGIAISQWDYELGLDDFDGFGPFLSGLCLIGLVWSALLTLTKLLLHKLRPGRGPQSYGWRQALNGFLLYCNLSIWVVLLTMGIITAMYGSILGGWQYDWYFSNDYIYNVCQDADDYGRCSTAAKVVAAFQVLGLICIFLTL